MAFLTGFASIAALVFGVLCMMASIVPSYGSRRDGRPAFVVGALFFLAGIAGVFYAGAWS